MTKLATATFKDIAGARTTVRFYVRDAATLANVETVVDAIAAWSQLGLEFFELHEPMPVANPTAAVAKSAAAPYADDKCAAVMRLRLEDDQGAALGKVVTVSVPGPKKAIINQDSSVKQDAAGMADLFTAIGTTISDSAGSKAPGLRFAGAFLNGKLQNDRGKRSVR